MKLTLMVVFLAVLGGGVWFYRVQERALRQHVEENLAAIGQLKVNQIVAWRQERLGAGAVLQENPLVARGVARFLADPRNRGSAELRAYLRSVQTHYQYADILVADADGRVHLSLSGSTEAHGGYVSVLAAALREGKPALTGLHTEARYPAPHLGVVAPLFSGTTGTLRPLGAVILVSDAPQFLFPLIQSWPTPSQSAETLLVQRDGDHVLFLNDLRHQPDTALKLRIPLSRTDVLAVMAVLGKQGVVEGVDYRGVEVVSALLPVPGSPWFLVAKVDATEAFAEWRLRAVLIVALFAGLAGMTVAVGFVAWQREKKRHYRVLYQSEAALRASVERHSVTLKAIGDAVIVTDAQGRVELLNPMAEGLTGWSDAEARGRPLEEIFRIVNEETRETVENPAARVLREGLIVGLANHTLLLSRDGREIPIADCGAPIRTEDGTITGVVLVFRDQTAERGAQRALRESEERFRRIYEESPVGYQSLDVEGRILDVNPAWLTLFGYTREEVIGRRVDEFFTPASQIAFAKGFPRFRETGASHGCEFEVRRKDGETMAVVFDGVFVRDAQGHPHHTHCVLHNITERRRAEEALRQSEARFRAIASHTPDHILVQDRDLRYSFVVNPQLGLTEADIIGKTDRDILGKEDAEKLTAIKRQVLERGEPVQLETSLPNLKGGPEYFEGAYIPTFDESGQTDGLIGYFRNVTDRKRAELELRLSEELFSKAFHVGPAGMTITRIADGKFIDINESFLRMCEFSREEVIGHTSTELNIWTLEERRKLIEKQVESGGLRDFELEARSRSGRIMNLLFSSKPIEVRGEPCHITTLIDITERKKAEEALVTRTRQLETVRTVGEEITRELDLTTLLNLIIRRAAELIGTSAGTIALWDDPTQSLSQRAWIGFGGWVGDMRIKLGEWVLGTIAERREGLIINDCRTSPLIHPLVLERSAITATLGEPLLYRNRLIGVITLSHLGSGRQFTEGDSRVLSLFSTQAAIAIENARLYEAAQLELTERKRLEAERLRLEVQLRQQQKLEAIGTLASGVAHEINNPITGIMNYAQLITDTTAPESETAGYASEIIAETERVAAIVKNLLQFARQEKQAHSPARVEDIIGQTLSLLQAVLRRDQITLAVDVPTDLPALKCRSQQLQQVLMNLLTNARDALNERYPGYHEDKMVRVTARELDERAERRAPSAEGASPGTGEGQSPIANRQSQMAERRWIRITVEDHGGGIPAEIQDRIFDPFFTTKPKEKGTGLGLSVSHGIVKDHQGVLHFETEPGQGTRFHLDLPVAGDGMRDA
jgi:PAS domain S-box-containing protein